MPNISSGNSQLNVYYQNVRSLKSKADIFLPNISATDHDVICLSETWFDSSVYSSEFFPPNFNVIRSDRDAIATGRSKGGGVLIAIKDTFISAPIETSVFRNVPLVDIVGCKIIYRTRSLFVFAVYIPPNISLAELQLFLEAFEECLLDVGDVLVVGDFNIPNFTGSLSDARSGLLHDFLSFAGLLQVNNVLNCNNRILDLVLHNVDNCMVENENSPLTNLDPYHPALNITIELKCGRSERFPFSNRQKLYNFRRANFMELYKDLANTDWGFLYTPNDLDVNQILNKFYNYIYSLFDKYVPTYKSNNNKYPRWYSAALRHKLRVKNYFFIKYKKFRNQFYYTQFSNLRQEVKVMVQTDYQNYLSEIQNNLSSNPKQFWDFVRNKKKQTTVSKQMFYNGVELNDPYDIANCFKEHFSSVFHSVPDINTQLLDDTSFHTINTSYMVEIDIVNREDIIKAVKKMKANMCSGIDNIPAFIIKDSLFAIMDPLLFIFNKCLHTCTFPEVWKKTRICPVPKGVESSDVSSYRPISILSNLAKIFESILFKYICPKIKHHISNMQHGFMSSRSTTTNLTCITQFLSNAFENRKQVDVVYLDMSKAFDKILHDVLLARLDRLGFSDSLLQLLRSYLNNRSLVVAYNGHISESFVQTSGVPQGSNLGPPLFNLYINDIIASCIQNSRCLLYADDIKVFKIVNSVEDCLSLQDDLNRLQNFAERNGLAFNVSKCKLLQYTKCTNRICYDYTLNNVVIEKVTSTKDLGVTFDSQLSFNDHTSNVIQSSLKMLGFIVRNTRSFNNIEALKSLYFSLVRSRLEYCTVVWSPFYKYVMSGLENVQRRFVKLLYLKAHKQYPSRGISQDLLLNEFNVESLMSRRIVNDIGFLFKIMSGKIDCPELLSQICINVPRVNLRENLTFVQQKCRTNIGINSPINRMCKHFNIYCKDCDIYSDNLNKIINSVKVKMLPEL